MIDSHRKHLQELLWKTARGEYLCRYDRINIVQLTGMLILENEELKKVVQDA